jgi:hypothetical protein
MEIAQNLSDPFVEQLSTDVIELRKAVLTQKSQIAVMRSTVTPSQNYRRPPSSPLRLFDSQILSDFPKIFAVVSTHKNFTADATVMEIL